MKSCTQCGKCCIKYADGGLVATQDEIAWWMATRPDIAAFASDDGQIWVDPDTASPLSECPWLQREAGRYHCQIYQQRPEDCRQYPVNLDQMVVDECDMIELRDLDSPARAQQALDKIISNR